jgi:hypothetical protein
MLSRHIPDDAFATPTGRSVRSQWKESRFVTGTEKGTSGVGNEESPRMILGRITSVKAGATDIDTRRGKKIGYSNGAGSNLDGI